MMQQTLGKLKGWHLDIISNQNTDDQKQFSYFVIKKSTNLDYKFNDLL
jgi:hypothetical protein